MKTDRYTVCLIFLFLFMFIGYRYGKTTGAIGMTLSFISFLATYYSKTRVIKNEFPEQFLALGETDGAEPEILPPGYQPTNFDGLKVNNRVFKAPNGTDVVIDRNGKIKFAGPGSYLISLVGGGGYQAPGSALSKKPKWKGLF